MPDTPKERLSRNDWRLLISRIKQGKCTPLLGAGACFGALPLGSDVAREWANEYTYPLGDSDDLARVAQYLAVAFDPMYPKDELIRRFIAGRSPPDFRELDEPHGVLANLPLPIYMTTDYDDFTLQALTSRNRSATQVICGWNQILRRDHPCGLDTDFEPSKDRPIVFHLHGHRGVSESLVLTEDDYLDFLVNITHERDLLPHQIRRALAGSTLLFIGYSLADWDFRVLFRGLVTSTEDSLRRLSITVQLPPVPADAPESMRRQMQGYLDQYFDKKDMHVYWGTAREFAADLREHWNEQSGDG